MFERVEAFVGKENLNKIKHTTVLIVGLGGVGGYAMEALARSGIGSLILIDFDKIDESNLNRQIITNQNNIGLYKVDVAKDRVLSINPAISVTTEKVFLDKNNINILAKGSYEVLRISTIANLVGSILLAVPMLAIKFICLFRL